MRGSYRFLIELERREEMKKLFHKNFDIPRIPPRVMMESIWKEIRTFDLRRCRNSTTSMRISIQQTSFKSNRSRCSQFEHFYFDPHWHNRMKLRMCCRLFCQLSWMLERDFKQKFFRLKFKIPSDPSAHQPFGNWLHFLSAPKWTQAPTTMRTRLGLLNDFLH